MAAWLYLPRVASRIAMLPVAFRALRMMSPHRTLCGSITSHFGRMSADKAIVITTVHVDSGTVLFPWEGIEHRLRRRSGPALRRSNSGLDAHKIPVRQMT